MPYIPRPYHSIVKTFTHFVRGGLLITIKLTVNVWKINYFHFAVALAL
jgi:hypothetical protein